jgi:hypothetical protein
MKTKIKNLSFALLLLIATGIIGSCVKQDFDRPPIKDIPVGQVYTIGELITLFNTSGATQFNTDASVYGVVTMDETTGNIYRTTYIQDATGAINVRLKEAGGLRVGDSVRVYLKNVILSAYNNMRQLDNVHNDSNIIILANQKYREPETVTITQLLSGNYQAKLIRLENVQFVAGDTALTYAATDASTNRTIEDCDGKSIIVRTSNFANFANKNLPNGNGSLIAVAGLFNSTWQLYVRTTTEVVMEGQRCGGGGGGGTDPVDAVNQDFNSVSDNVDIAFNGWTNIAEAGTRKWQGKIFSGNGYAQASGYNSNLSSMITWLITPPVKMDQAKLLRFKTAKAFWEHGTDVPMTVLVSSNFDGINVAAASWTPITARIAAQSDGDNAWIESGDIDLSAFIPEGKISVAFKYVGSGTKSTSMRIDDVYIGTEGGGGGGGDVGTIDNPYTVEQAIENQNATPYVAGWVSGYIVGAVKSGISSVTSAADINFSPPFDLATNVLIASNMNETDYTKCVIVNLPAGTPLRTQVNLMDNPTNLKKLLKVTGTLRTYFGVAGLRDAPGQTGDFVLEGGGGGGGTGSGTMADPYTVASAIENQNATPYVVGWVKGYIVGSVVAGTTTITAPTDIHWTGPFTSATNIVIADTKTETDYTKCVIVNLPAGSALRTQVNLLDNPGNHLKWVNVTGTLRTYFGIAGLRDAPGTTSDFQLETGGGGGGGGDAIFTEEFTTTLGTFSAFSVDGAQVWNWANFDGGCALMSGYANTTNNPNEDWLVSPAIDLSTNTGSILNVRQAANYVSSQWDLLQVMISSNYDGTSNPNTQGTWTELQVPNRPAGTNWTFVDSGDISISAYDGQSAVYIAFRYRSTSTVASSWEISKVVVK